MDLERSITLILAIIGALTGAYSAIMLARKYSKEPAVMDSELNKNLTDVANNEAEYAKTLQGRLEQYQNEMLAQKEQHNQETVKYNKAINAMQNEIIALTSRVKELEALVKALTDEKEDMKLLLSRYEGEGNFAS